MKKLKSVLKKGKTIAKEGIEPFKEGVYNFLHPSPEMEKLAKERAEICFGCKNFIDEPNDLFRVGGELGVPHPDSIAELTNKSCDDCGCIISYKLRQNKKICELW